MPQAALAAAMVQAGHAKWSQSTVWSIEKGARPLRYSEAEALGEILGGGARSFSLSGETRTIEAILSRVGDHATALGWAAKRLEAAQDEFRRYVSYLGKTLDDLDSVYLEIPGYRAWIELPVPEIAAAALESDGGRVGVVFTPGTEDSYTRVATDD